MVLLIWTYIKVLKSILNHDDFDAYDAFAHLDFIENFKKCFKS